MGKLKLMTIIGTRPEIIRLSATIKCCDRYFEQILVHTGQNYDYTLNQVFFDDLGLRAPDYYLDAVGDDLGATIGNIIEKSYKLMVQVRPDAVLVLGDTNSCLSVIGAKRLHIPTFLRSGCTFLCFTWRPATAARMSACRRRRTAASWTSSATSISAIRSMHAGI